VEQHFPDHFGTTENFHFAVSAEDARAALAYFIDFALPCFGDFQDAMSDQEDWLFHSILSPYLNCGLLDPMEVCQAAAQAWYSGRAPINAVEGFIRQILGWREFVRGIYWLTMPDYARENGLGNQRPLPWFYWSGDTRMHCMRRTIDSTRRNGYAHHIQRLMVVRSNRPAVHDGKSGSRRNSTFRSAERPRQRTGRLAAHQRDRRRLQGHSARDHRGYAH
ncbi:MAG: hypothetical protein ACF8TS_06775, partial [Maioricimonas sp. JB049]